ncbi:hypothetical protein AWC38_SpisGene23906, partial [Stylophora pistillata]
MDLLNICLTSTYFQYNGKHYKQLHGTAMGSPVSVVIAEIVMQNIEERALSTCRQTIPLWLRYVDDTFTAVRHDEIDAFHNHLNEQNTDIQFTREVEENGKLPFLDCLVSHNDNSLRTTVYRKPTHTDRLLDESSYNPTSHKATTIRTLTRRAQLVCDSTDSLSDENKYLHRVFTKNNYNNDFIRRNTHRPTTTTETNDTATPTTTATIPYIKGMSENISRILLPFNIRVAHKPITTLRQLLTNVKDKDEPRNRQGTIYKINCSDCQASYIGETGRNLTTRLTEHRRATRKVSQLPMDIITMNETWLKDHPVLLDYVNLPGYTALFRNREGSRGGGVGAYINDSIQYKRRKDIEKIQPVMEHLWIEIQGRNKHSKALIGVIYRSEPVGLSPLDWLGAFESLLAHLTVSWDGLLFLTGDTNVDMLKPSDNIIKQYRSILEALGCYRHVTKPTRITRTSKTLIDHIVTNSRSCITATDVIPGWSISDHEGIFACVNVRVPRYQPRYKWIRLEKNLNVNEFVKNCACLPLSVIYGLYSPDDTVQGFNTLF